MPRKPIDHSKTIIYKIVCNNLSVMDLYVGHTTDWVKRKSKHKRLSINPNSKNYNCKVYQMIRANGGWENWTMIEIEKYPCADIYEATTRERYWYENLNASMNTNRPIITNEELQKEQNERSKEYYKQNILQCRKQHKEYADKNKEKTKITKIKNIDRNRKKEKEYRENNKELIAEKQKLYYENNIEKIKINQKINREKRKLAKLKVALDDMLSNQDSVGK